MKKIKETYEDILKIEKELKLFEHQINGIFFWKLIRVYIGGTLCTLHDDKVYKKKLKDKIIYCKNICINSIFYSIFHNHQKVDVLFFEDSRKVINKLNGKYYDPYTFYYIKNFQKNTTLKYQIIDHDQLGKHFEHVNERRKFAENIFYDIIYKIYLKLFFKVENINIITVLEQKLFEIFEIKIDVKNILFNTMLNFKYQYKKFGKLFDIKQPKEIYIVRSCGKEGMILAAKERGIKVIELQHGTIEMIDFQYSFPKNIFIPYFPDKFIVFGKYWQKSASLPINDIEIFGFPHLTNNLSKYYDMQKNDKQILIISQPIVSYELIPYVLKLAKNNPNFNFIYRFHPDEKYNWKDLYPMLTSISLKNFILDDTNSDLYKLMATSTFLISVFSTAIFESLMFGTKVIVLNLDTSIFVDLLVKNNNIMKINVDEIIDFDNLQFNCKPIDKNYFFYNQKSIKC